MAEQSNNQQILAKVSTWITLGGWGIVVIFGSVIWNGVQNDRMTLLENQRTLSSSGKDRDKAIQALAIEVTRVITEMKGMDERIDRLESGG